MLIFAAVIFTGFFVKVLHGLYWYRQNYGTSRINLYYFFMCSALYAAALTLLWREICRN